jgi:hypothetical protein
MVGVEPTTCCLRNYPSVRRGLIVVSVDRIGMPRTRYSFGHVRTQNAALDGTIDNEIDNMLHRAHVPTTGRTMRVYPLLVAQRAQGAPHDRS